jgi:MFS family permease
MLLSLSVKAIGSVIAIFSQDYASFVIGRFMGGVGNAGTCLSSFVLGKENYLAVY